MAYQINAYPNPSSGLAMKEFQNNLSRRVCAFLVPMRLTSSTVCWGVKASMANNPTEYGIELLTWVSFGGLNLGISVILLNESRKCRARGSICYIYNTPKEFDIDSAASAILLIYENTDRRTSRQAEPQFSISALYFMASSPVTLWESFWF